MTEVALSERDPWMNPGRVPFAPGLSRSQSPRPGTDGAASRSLSASISDPELRAAFESAYAAWPGWAVSHAPDLLQEQLA